MGAHMDASERRLATMERPHPARGRRADQHPRRAGAERAGLVACWAVGLALAALFAARWRGGWLLLLDWAPGPASVEQPAHELPSGPALDVLVDLLSRLSTNFAGWGTVAAGVLVAYAGGIRLARSWRGPGASALSWWASLAAGCVAAANPFVVARVYSGQVGVLWGYALLWFFAAQLARSFDRDDPRASIVPALWCALAAAFTLHLVVVGSVLAAIFAVVQSRRTGPAAAFRRFAVFVAVTAGVTAAWVLPELARSGQHLGTAGGAAGADIFSSGGPWWSLWLRAAGGAGFWRAVPDGTLLVAGLVVAAAWVSTVVGWRFGSGWSRDLRLMVLASAVVAVGVAHLGRGPSAGPWGWFISWFTPAGLIREPGKFTMLAMLAPACGAAAAVQRLLDARGGEARALLPHAGRVLLGAAAVGMVATWLGVTSRVTPSEHPSEWRRARAAVEVDRCKVAVLGDGAYADPGFTDSRIVANPAKGFFGARAVVSVDPQLPGLAPRPASSPDQRWLAEVNGAWLRGSVPEPDAGSARAAGIGWVFVDRPVDRPLLAAALDDAGFRASELHDRAGLWRVPGGCS